VSITEGGSAMNTLSANRFSRRRFLANASALSAASLFGLPRTAAAEPPPETTKIRLLHLPGICLAPNYIAEELLRLEGFSDVEYVQQEHTASTSVVDIWPDAPMVLIPGVDAGEPLVALAGLHGGCYELFAHERVRAIRDLKNRRVAVTLVGSLEYYYVASIMAYVGIDPRRDIQWIEGKTFDDTMRTFIDGKADAFLAFPPQPQQLRAQKIGHVIVNTTQDRPWEQYFCCMIAARREFVTRNPVATKRAMRAILKAADICAREPERAARYIVAKGYEPSYEIALEVVTSLSYDRWRTYDLEDTLRFYALRLHEVGMIKSTPQKIIAQSLDLRFLKELKKELKA
jgi:NitT/TauT family transport system substrate-binding protein